MRVFGYCFQRRRVVTAHRFHLCETESCTCERKINFRIPGVEIEVNCESKVSFTETDLVDHVYSVRCADDVQDTEVSEVEDGVEQRPAAFVNFDLREGIVAMWQQLALCRECLFDQIEPTAAT